MFGRTQRKRPEPIPGPNGEFVACFRSPLARSPRAALVAFATTDMQGQPQRMTFIRAMDDPTPALSRRGRPREQLARHRRLAVALAVPLKPRGTAPHAPTAKAVCDGSTERLIPDGVRCHLGKIWSSRRFAQDILPSGFPLPHRSLAVKPQGLDCAHLCGRGCHHVDGDARARRASVDVEEKK